ncbi:hypothetical protein [Nonomuraea candida]|uniref:hypothetical protein n=1 Tax=Nonomuraea candida TaxID=359159 RepID=UPI0005BD4EF3|nr:hypothetical protein [Nonomuraea candida]
MTVVDLRYSAASLRQARRAGHRPRPQLLRHKVEVYSWARSDPRDRSVSEWADIEERRARQRLRLRLGAVRRTVNAPTDGPRAAEAIDDLDVLPARHRRNAIWLY